MIRREAVLEVGVVRCDEACWHVHLLQKNDHVRRFRYGNYVSPCVHDVS